MRRRAISTLAYVTLLMLASCAAPVPGASTISQVSPLPTPGTCGALASIQFPVMVQGLREEHAAELRLLPDWPETAALLTECGIVLPTWTVGNESRGIETVRIPDGGYQLVIDAPPDYFRDPKGYSFQVTGGRVVRYPGGSLEFKLVPPSEQRLPPCREPFVAPTGGPIEETRDLSQPGIDVCQSEGTVCLSCSPKQAPLSMPEMGGNITGLLDEEVRIRVRTVSGSELHTIWRLGNGLWRGPISDCAEMECIVTATAQGYTSTPVSYTVRLSDTIPYVVRDGQVTSDEALHLDFHFVRSDR